MIQEEANVVTGSFYHFFASKELLFEVVIERFLAGYSERINEIYEVLQGDKLHWTIQHSLHNKTLETIVASVYL